MSRSRSISSLIILLASLIVTTKQVHAQAAPTVTEDSTQARNLFRQGAAAMKDGKYAEARKALLEAWGIRRTYDVAAILGQAELELKLYRDAAEHLDYALKNFAPRESAETLEKVKTGLQTAKLQVAELRISVNEPSAQILLDGEQMGTSPLPSSLFVTTGAHTIEARLDTDRVPPPNHNRLLERQPHLRKTLKLLGRKVELHARASRKPKETSGLFSSMGAAEMQRDLQKAAGAEAGHFDRCDR